jgi:hypothetical protein
MKMKEDHRMMNLNELRGQTIVDNTHKRDSLDHKCTSKRAVDSNAACNSMFWAVRPAFA